MSLGKTFQERYITFFKFFNDSSKSISEINNFIKTNTLKNQNQYIISLDMIDIKNLNILFHVIRKSKKDEECLEKLKYLVEEYNINYNVFDINQRTLPFYTCVKGYFNCTKYLLEKMNYNISIKDKKEETLFFSAIRSYNIELVKYLDNKYKGWIYYPNNDYESCIFNIFKKSMKEEGENKIKNIFRFILEKGFDIEEKNKNNVTFKDLCKNFGVEKYLEDVLKEYNISNINKNEKVIKNCEKENKDINAIDIKNNIKNCAKKINKSKNEEKSEKNISQKINGINKIKSNINQKKMKKKCCLFINNEGELLINLITDRISESEFLKEKFLKRINNFLQIPSFEKGSINEIQKTLSKGK